MPPNDPSLSNSAIRRGLNSEVRSANPSRNWATLAISVARVKEVLYEDLKCTLVVISGEEDYYEYAGVDLTAAAAGRRHFLGALPEPGDYCYVGWSARESAGRSSAKSPVILGWIPAAPWMGREWLPYSPLEPSEGLSTPGDRAVAAGTLDRVRFKMRHLAPGNVFLSSSSGADIVLDEGVSISNRRANEIRIRDADQAILFRALSQFSALGGTRIYGGPVAREARLLPTAMFSDGTWWDAPRQVDPGTTNVRTPDSLGDSPYPRDYLTPGLIFRRPPGASESSFETARETELDARLDPFDFLQWGLLVDPSGYATAPGETTPSVVYGGKALYRVGLGPDGSPTNAAADSTASDAPPPESLSEYRIEVSHSSDGTLPVTEQTDGFDADRLPSGPGGASKTPFVEWVLGSVVGNDPFSTNGRPLYGLPLRAEVVRDGEVSPGIVSAVGRSLKDHAATLFRITPPIGEGESSFTSFTKDGRFRAYLAGTEPDSADIATKGDLSLSVGGALKLRLSGGIELNGSGVGPGNVGLALGSPTGAVVIRGGGSVDSGAAARADAPAVAPDAPSVSVAGDSNVSLSAGRSVSIAAPRIEAIHSDEIALGAGSSVTLASGGRLSETAVTVDRVISGAETVQYGGPRDSNPANGPSRRVTFSSTPATGSTGGVTDRYTMVFGDRLEEFTLRGSSTTRILTIGDLTYETNGGSVTARAGANRTETSSTSGIATTVGTGSASVAVATGGFSVTAASDVSIRSGGGTATISATAGVTLASNGTVSGGVVCGGDREPLTGLPYSTFLPPRGVTIRPG